MSESAVSGNTHIRRPLARDRVPVLPPGVPYLLQALHDDNLGFVRIARAIEQVPTVAARLLALANSAWSAPASPVTSLEAACSRLGVRVVRTVSIAIAVSQPFNPARCPAFDGATFWISALLNAEAAGWLARRALPGEQSAARTAGLLSNLGLLWLAEALPDETGRALTLARETPLRGIEPHLVDHCGVGYVEAGALLAEAWQLPSGLRDAIACQLHDGAQGTALPLLVGVATRLTARLRHADREGRPEDPAMLLRLGLDAGARQAGLDYLDGVKARTTELAETLFGGPRR